MPPRKRVNYDEKYEHPGYEAGRTDFFRPDRWKRPYVPVDGEKYLKVYSRASSFALPIEDRSNLEKWFKRQVMLGTAAREDLQLAALAHRNDKHKLDDLAEQAMAEAKSGARATIGTAVHALTEELDAGAQVPETLPRAYRADLEAYKAATKDVEVISAEHSVVCDELKVAGTFDRLVRYQGKVYIADIKTGSTTDFSGLTFAVQLACYAHGSLFDLEHYERTEWPSEPPDRERALVIHLPAGEGRCSLKWLDIRDGWDAAHLASVAKALQKRTDWFEVITEEESTVETAADTGGSLFDPTDTIWQVVNNCRSITETRAAYSQLVAAGHSKDAVLAACLERNKMFEGNAA